MLNRSNIQWSGKTLYNMVKKEKVNFDNYVQRNLVWDDERKSLFIHSMISGYPVPPFYAARNEDQYDLLDGKQRSNAVVDFIDSKFELKLDEDYGEITVENGETLNLCGKKFEDLPEEIQDKIKDFSLTIYYFDGITDEEIEEMFFRLNNGKALSAIELTRVKAKSFDTIKELATHELFDIALTDKAKQKYSNEDIVIKTYITIYGESLSYMTKDVRAAMQNIEITAEQADHIKAVFDKILTVYRAIQNSATKIAKKILRRTHLVSLTKLASEVDKHDLRAFVLAFFDGKGRSATVSDAYNRVCQYGSAKPESVIRRLSEMQDYYDLKIKPRNTDMEVSIEDLDLPEITDDDLAEIAI